MKLAAALAGGVIALAASQAQAATVEIEDAVARVVVIPEARSDIHVEFLSKNPDLPITVRSRGLNVYVDGDLGRNIRACRGSGENVSVTVSGVGEVPWSEMPQIVIRTPMDVNLEAGGAVFGAIGRSGSVKLANAGCGDWIVANTAGALDVSQAGSGDVRAGNSGEARLRVAGSGDFAARRIAGGFSVDIAGSGDVSAEEISGPLDVDIAGSGDVKVGGGQASLVSVSVAGSGNVDFRGVAGDVKARIAGSGDVRVREVTGEVSKTVMGSGKITVG